MKPAPKIQIAKPCPVSWDKMDGDDRVRHCHKCKKNVYNIANFTTDEVLDLISVPADQLPCMRLYQRADGTVMTSDCRIGVREVWIRRGLLAAVIYVFLALYNTYLTKRSHMATGGPRVIKQD